MCSLRQLILIPFDSDDTSVAVLHSPSSSPSTATLLAHKTITCPNRIYGGIHPLVSVSFHRSHLAALVSSVLPSLPNQRKPDLVAVTRGPGMLASLAVGLDTAKGLALAWRVPLIGVNHMQAHALTPRLLSALENGEKKIVGGVLTSEFPFMTLLVSGGHTMVLKSTGLTDHTILAKTIDIALGDVVDKCARTILPTEVLEQKGDSVAYGAVLEEYCFSDREGEEDMYRYHVEGSAARKLEDGMDVEKWGDWKLSKPLTKTGLAKKLMEFSFSGLGSTLDRYFESKITAGQEIISEQERKEIGRKLMMLAFEHVASRVVMGLDSLGDDERRAIKHLVVSGGVAANRFLKHMWVLNQSSRDNNLKLTKWQVEEIFRGERTPRYTVGGTTAEVLHRQRGDDCLDWAGNVQGWLGD